MTRNPFVALLGLVMLGGVAVACSPAADGPAPATLPDMTVTSLAGDELSFASFLGDKPLLVWFWAPW